MRGKEMRIHMYPLPSNVYVTSLTQTFNAAFWTRKGSLIATTVVVVVLVVTVFDKCLRLY